MGTELPDPQKGHSLPQFSAHSIVAKRSPVSAAAELLYECGFIFHFRRLLNVQTVQMVGSAAARELVVVH